MKKLAVVLCLVVLTSAAPGQALPKVTEEGRKAAVELLIVFDKAGAIKFVTDPTTKERLIVVADIKKLQETARERRDAFTPAVRNILIGMNKHPGVVSLLQHLAREKGDEEGAAFGWLFAGDLAWQQLKYREAMQAYEQAVGCFARVKKPEWKAASLNNLAKACHAQGDLPQAGKLHQQTLELCIQLYGQKHREVAVSLGNLASVYHEQGDLLQARKLLQQALELRKQLYGEKHPEVANGLNNLAGSRL